MVQGMELLLDSYQAYGTLASLLTSLSDLFHDRAESVRLAFIKLLIKAKHIRALKDKVD